MTEKALGIIETMGLVPAIEAADIGLKTAEVALAGLEMTGAGLVAIMLRGDVSSVKEAVAAGSRAATRLGQVVSTTVIARTGEGLDSMLPAANGDCPPSAPTASPAGTRPAPARTEPQMPAAMPDLEQLNAMSVVRLRTFVRTLESYPMTRDEIRSARKQDLLAKIVEYYRDKGIKP